MALPPPNDAQPNQHQSFHAFYNAWLVGQNQHLQELHSAVSQAQQQDLALLAPLLERIVEHYGEYYRVKAEWRRRSVLRMLSPTWTSSLENAHLWIGGWRPSTAFHLLQSKSTIQLAGCRLSDIIRRAWPDDLGGLSQCQTGRIDELQGWTIQKERKISEKMAKAQEGAAATDVVKLSNTPTELVDEYSLAWALEAKEERLEKVVGKADRLRLRTLRGVIGILEPIQAAHYLISAAELHLKFHDWGMWKDGAGNE